MDEPLGEDAPQILGGNIELIGFRNLDGGSMIVLKKIIGNYARKFSDKLNGINKLSLRMNQDAGKFALSCELIAGEKSYSSEHSDQNLFFVIDSVLKKIDGELR